MAIDRRLVMFLAKTLVEKGLTLSIAESCTGGLLSDTITDVPGSSDYFTGAVIAYSNEVKTKFLGVKAATLRKHGAVSRETAQEMASGARKRFRSAISVAMTGIAGPSGGSARKPVGTVFISISLKCKGMRGFDAAKKFNFRGDRASIKRQTVEKALKMLSSTVAVCV